MKNLAEALEVAQEIQIDSPKVGSALISNINFLMSSELSELEKIELIFSEFDALDNQDEIEEGTLAWNDVRDFQHELVKL